MKKSSRILLIVVVIVLIVTACGTAFADARPYSASKCLYGFWTGSLTQIYDEHIKVDPNYSWIGSSSNPVAYKSGVCVGQNLNNNLTGMNKTGTDSSGFYTWGTWTEAPGYKRYLYGRIENAYFPGQNMHVAGTIYLEP